MRNVRKTRCHPAPVRAGARFSTPERVENTEFEVEFEGENQAQGKKEKKKELEPN